MKKTENIRIEAVTHTAAGRTVIKKEIPISRLSYLEKVTHSHFFIFFKDGTSEDEIRNGSLQVIHPNTRDDLELDALAPLSCFNFV